MQFVPAQKNAPPPDSQSCAPFVHLLRKLLHKGTQLCLPLNIGVIFQKESLVLNQPLTSGDQSKIVIFIILFVPSVFFGVGVIPAIFLIFGIFMMKKNEDYNHIETAVRNVRGYISLILVGCIIAIAYNASTYGNPEYYWHFSSPPKWKNDDAFFFSCVFGVISFVYLVLVNVLFLNPLKAHSEWVAINGIFSSKNKSSIAKVKASDVDIIKGEKLKQYSVADELLKWAKLKDDGHISADEFNEAREKLLKRS